MLVDEPRHGRVGARFLALARVDVEGLVSSPTEPSVIAGIDGAVRPASIGGMVVRRFSSIGGNSTRSSRSLSEAFGIPVAVASVCTCGAACSPNISARRAGGRVGACGASVVL